MMNRNDICPWCGTTDSEHESECPGKYIDALRAENARLREALEPFAKAADKADASSETAMRLVGSGHSDDCTPGWGINYGHVKAARAALERTP